MNSADITVYWKDLQGIYTGYYQFGNANAEEFEQKKQSIIGKTDYDLYSKEIANQYRQQDLDVISKKQEISFVDAQQLIRKKPLYDASSNIVGIIATVMEIPPEPAAKEDKDAIKKIIQDAVGKTLPQNLTAVDCVKYFKKYFEHIINSIPANVFWVDKAHTVLGCNNMQANYLGFETAEEVIQTDIVRLLQKAYAAKEELSLISPEIMQEHALAIQSINKEIMETGQVRLIEEFSQQPDKTDIFLTQKAPLYDLEGEMLGVIGISFNITEKKRQEEQRLNLIFQASNMGIWTWNFADDSFIHDHMNYKGPYRLASSLEDVILRANPADQEILRQALQTARDQKTTLDLEYRLTWIDGSPRHFAMRGKVVEDKQGQPYCMVGICWDITERKHQEELRQKQQVVMAQVSRQNAMGELASTLAHELNQPLAAISNYIDGCIIRLQNGQSQTSDLLRAMQLASVQSARAGEIIHRIKNFMRRGELIFTATDINHVVNDIITTMQFELTSNQVKLNLELNKKLPKLQIDEIQIGQVVLNLLRNAVEAMQGNNTELPEITIKTTQKNKQVFIDVIDNGPGCPEEIANQLFTAYFTTKKNGMGIGLAICRSIIEAHEGQLVIMPYQKGAWFRFSLPIGNTLIDPAKQANLAYPEL